MPINDARILNKYIGYYSPSFHFCNFNKVDTRRRVKKDYPEHGCDILTFRPSASCDMACQRIRHNSAFQPRALLSSCPKPQNNDVLYQGFLTESKRHFNALYTSIRNEPLVTIFQVSSKHTTKLLTCPKYSYLSSTVFQTCPMDTLIRNSACFSLDFLGLTHLYLSF